MYKTFWDIDIPKIIDCHVHLGASAGLSTLEDALTSAMKKADIDLALVSPVNGAEFDGNHEIITDSLNQYDSNMEAAELVQKNKQFRGVVWGRPYFEGNTDNLSVFFTEHNFVAVKIHPFISKTEADSPKMNPYIEMAREFKVPVVIHTAADDWSKPERAYRLAQRYPDVKFVFFHAELGSDHQNAIKIVKEALRKNDADLYIDTSWVAPDAVLKAISELGSSRILFGSDAALDGEEHYRWYIPQLELIKQRFTRDDLENIFYRNAEKLFNL